MVASAKQSIPEVNEFTKLFPNYQEEITSDGRGVVGDRWQFSAETGDRHVVEMDLDVTLGIPPRVNAAPRFMLLKLIKTDRRNGYTTTEFEIVKEFGRDEWRKLVDSGGDLKALGASR